jgi:hypothetical protein
VNNVAALIEADKAVHTDMETRYKNGPYWDGMYGVGMIIELGRRGFIIVPVEATWAQTHEHDFRRTLVDGVVVDVRCACGAEPRDLLSKREMA